MKRAGIALFVALLATGAFGGDPNQKRGFNAADVYQVGEIDQVNLFNGNVTLQIPIGQTYQIGPQLQYQLILSYNSKLWDYKFEDYRAEDCQFQELPCGVRYGIPDETTNAGFGWTLSMGRLSLPGTNLQSIHGLGYIGPDGAEHEFDYSIDPPQAQAPLPAAIIQARTTDSSYLQLRKLSADRWRVEFPDGHVQEFDALGRLVETRDRFQNWMRVSYTDTRWTITDGYGEYPPTRTHYVNFADKSGLYGVPSFKYVVSSVELDVFDNTPSSSSNDRAVYTMSYDDRWVGRGGGGERLDAVPSFCITAPFLTSVVRPDGTAFSATYSKLIPPSTDPTPPQCIPIPGDRTSIADADSGMIKTLALPTGGSIEWTHGIYKMNAPACRNGVGYAETDVGVRERKYKSASGAELMKWTYTPTLVPITSPPTINETCEGHYGGIPTPAEVFTNDVEIWSGPAGSGGKRLFTRNYFSAFPKEARAPFDGATARGFKPGEYGRPFTHNNALGSASTGDLRLLSAEVFDCTTSCTGDDPLNRSYVLYETDSIPSIRSEVNPRVAAERTVELKDTGCAGAPCYTDVKRSEWDGFGHYQRSVSTNNFAGAPVRTTFTNHTPDTTRWLLELYTTSWTMQSADGVTSASKSIATFDADTGVMTSLRTLKATGADPEALSTSNQDLVTATCRDSSVLAGQRGFVTSERRFGGDTGSIPTDLCGAPRTDGNYFVDHFYTFGGSGATAHQAQYNGTSHYIADELFDTRTGLVRQSKDSAGLTTTFEYDPMGRLTWTKPQANQGAWTHYEYRAPATTTSGRAELAVRQRPNGSLTGTLTEQINEYDDLGRLWRERKRLKDGVSWSSTDTRYDGAGRPVKVSVTGLFTGSEPTRWTTTSYDVLGRPVSVTMPDGKTITSTYAGSRLMTRSYSVATAAGDTPTSVTQESDPFGHLIRVRDASDPAAEAAGEWVEARYKYGVSGKLIEARIEAPGAAAQIRNFDYDGRSLLRSETQPESGTATFQYDSGGHIRQRSDAGATVSFDYDPAERLIAVKSGSSILKELAYANTNIGSGDYSRGKLSRAVRHNYHPLLPGGDVTVTETYRYGGTGGALSFKQTVIGTGETFTDSYAYDQLGAPLSITYPSCIAGCGSFTQPARTVTNEYVNGFLSAVGNYAGPIEYHPNGMVKSIRHKNAGMSAGTFVDGPLYEQTLSSTGMPRPETIMLSNACTGLRVTDPPDAATINSGQSVTLSATVPGATSYQWYQGDNGWVAGATSSSLTISPAATTTYWVRASNGTCTIDSPPATVTVNGSVCTGSASITVLPADPDTIQPGGFSDLRVTLTGTGPWNITWSDGVPQPAYASSWARRVENIQTTTEFTATVVDANGCPGTSSGSALVTVISGPVCPNPGATATVSGSTTIAAGESTDIKASLTGAAPWTITWSDGVTETVSFSPRWRHVTPGKTTVYTITEVADKNGCIGTSSGSAQVIVTACDPPQVTMSNVPDTMAPGTEQTANVSATPSSGATYAWTITGGTPISGATTTAFRFRTGCGPATVSVKVTASCGKSTTVSKTIAVTTPSPVLTAGTVQQGSNGTLTVSMQGTAPWTLAWSDGVSETATSATHQRIIANVQATTTYTVTATDASSCSQTSNAAVLTVMPPEPVMLGAVGTGPDRALVSWSFSGSADRFDIQRFDRAPGSPGVYRVVGSAPSTATAYTEIGLPANTSFLYRVVAVKSGVSSSESMPAMATTTAFTNASIAANTSLIRAVDVTELLAAVNAVRTLAGLSAVTLSNPGPASSAAIRGAHVTELRTALDNARAVLGLAPVAYSQTSSPKVLAIHITELRGGVE